MATEGRGVTVEFCGEWTNVAPGESFTIGREGDLEVEDNPYLHRRFLELRDEAGLWLLVNHGGQIAATVSDDEGRFHCWLAPGAHAPLVFESSFVRFTAGPTSYEVVIRLDDPPFSPGATRSPDTGETTLGRVVFNEEQRLLVLALAEPSLRADTPGRTQLPTTAIAAARLGWPVTKFNRKLDYVCQKLTNAGIRGLHGGPDQLASDRRARLVEYALATRLVTAEDLDDLGPSRE